MIFAYKLENMINGLIYIGITENPEIRFYNHISACKNNNQQLIYRAMRKYGMNNFKFEVIAQTPIHEYKWELEQLLISQYESHIIGYNMNMGGNDASHLTGKAPARIVSTGEHIGQISLTDPRWELFEIESVNNMVDHNFSTNHILVKRFVSLDDHTK